MSRQNFFSSEDKFWGCNRMIVHAILIATMEYSILIGCSRVSSKDVAVFGSGNRATNFPPIEDAVVHTPYSGRSIGITIILNIRRYAGSSRGICIKRVRTIDKDSQHPTKLSKHVIATDNLFPCQRETKPDDVNEVALEDSGMLEIAFRFQLRYRNCPSTFLLNFLEFLSPFTFLLCCRPFLCFLRSLLGIYFRKLEILFLVWSSACRTSGGHLLADVM